MLIRKLLIQTYRLSAMLNFASEVFDFEVLMQGDRFALSLGETELLFVDGKGKGASILDLEVALNSPHELKELHQKIQFLFYKNKNVDVELLESNIQYDTDKEESFFTLLDPEKRFWRFYAHSKLSAGT